MNPGAHDALSPRPQVKWEELPVQMPFKSYGHCAVSLPGGQSVFVVWRDKDGPDGAVLHCGFLDLAKWEFQRLPNSNIQARSHFTCVLYRDRLYVYGGKSNAYLGDLCSYSLATGGWELITPRKSAQSRCTSLFPLYGHTAVVVEDSMVTFGGFDSQGFCCHEVHVFNFLTHEWMRENASSTVSNEQLARYLHTAVLYGRTMLVFGGWQARVGGSTLPSAIMEYHVDTKSWSELATAGTPPLSRYGHAACLCKNNMFVFGGWGSDGKSYFSDLHQFNCENRTWLPVIFSCVSPTPRASLIMFIQDNKLVIHGGQTVPDKLLARSPQVVEPNKILGDAHFCRIGPLLRKGPSRSRKKRDKERSRERDIKDDMNGSSSRDKQTGRPDSCFVKLHDAGRKRMIMIPESLSFAKFQEQIEISGAPCELQYRLSDGDFISLDSQQDWNTMRALAMNNLDRIVDVHVSRRVSESAGPMISSGAQKSGTANSQNLLQDSSCPVRGDGDEHQSIYWVQGQMIGQGAFGSVYKAMNALTGELMAVKQVRGAEGIEPNLIGSLRKEVELLRSFDHPNIVKFYGCTVDTDTSLMCVFIEYVGGGSLHSYILAATSLSEPLARAITRQVLCGLAYLHNLSIFHRDVKSANILLSEDGTAKLVDFGCAKKVEEAVTLTHGCKTVTGTPYWMAPEVIHGITGYDGAKADVWSLAAVVVEMLNGSPPFRELAPMAALFRIGALTGPPDLPQNVSPDCEDFLRQCFAIVPEDRPETKLLLSHPFPTSNCNHNPTHSIRVRCRAIDFVQVKRRESVDLYLHQQRMCAAPASPQPVSEWDSQITADSSIPAITHASGLSEEDVLISLCAGADQPDISHSHA